MPRRRSQATNLGEAPAAQPPKRRARSAPASTALQAASPSPAAGLKRTRLQARERGGAAPAAAPHGVVIRADPPRNQPDSSTVQAADSGPEVARDSTLCRNERLAAPETGTPRPKSSRGASPKTKRTSAASAPAPTDRQTRSQDAAAAAASAPEALAEPSSATDSSPAAASASKRGKRTCKRSSRVLEKAGPAATVEDAPAEALDDAAVDTGDEGAGAGCAVQQDARELDAAVLDELLRQGVTDMATLAAQAGQAKPRHATRPHSRPDGVPARRMRPRQETSVVHRDGLRVVVAGGADALLQKAAKTDAATAFLSQLGSRHKRVR